MLRRFGTQNGLRSLVRRLGRHAWLVAIVASPLWGSTSGTSVSPTATGGQTSHDPVVEDVLEVLRVLRQQNLLPPGDRESIRGIVRAILREIGTDAELELATPATVDDASAGDGPVVGRREVVGGAFLLLQVHRVSGDTEKAMREALAGASSGHYDGGILDLRYATGSDADAPGACSEFLAQLKLPLVLLTNGQTAGAAETLAVRLKEKADAVLVGQPTRGMPANWRRHVLRSGDRLLLPERPADGHGATAVVRSGVRPDVPVEQALPREVLQPPDGESGPRPETDACLQKAIDLLTAIRALASKHF